MEQQSAMGLRPAKKENLKNEDTGKTVEGLAMQGLTAYVRQCFEQSQTAKMQITERLLQCERQRRGVYDPVRMAEIRATGGSDIYMMLTDIKCRAAQSWIKDVLMNAQDRPWSLAPTPVPDLPEHMRQDIIEHIVTEAMQVQQDGTQINPEAINIRLDEIVTEVNEALKKKAKEAAANMTRKIDDILKEAKFDDTYDNIIDDFVTYPSAFLKGPVVCKRKGLTWGAGFTPVVTNSIARDFYRISPYDAFPAPNATGVDDEYFIERLKLNRKTLQDMIGMPGCNDDQIKSVLDLYGKNGLKNWRAGDSEHERLEGKTATYYTRGLIECLEFWGSVSGQMLMDWGMKGLDPYQDYEANVWVIGPYTVRCVLNSDPLGRRPYEVSQFVKIPGSIWGMALPELMRDVQTMCNASARALANNMSIASGPQVEVTIDRVPLNEPISKIYPWKIWQTTSDKSGSGQPAVRFFQPSMNADVLMSVYQYFQKVADEVTGVPNYIYGSSQASGAGRTASGLSMLMENAAKGIKHAILSLDRGVSSMLQRLFEHLMIYDPDMSIKGDMNIVPSGVVATIIKDNVQLRRQEFLQTVTNPVDVQLMGPEKRANLLRELAKGLDMPVDDVIPTPEEIGQQVAKMQATQMAQMQAQQAGAPQPDQQPQQPQQPPQMPQPQPAPQSA